MENTNKKLDSGAVSDENIDEILSIIRKVISEQDNVLILTDKVEDEMEAVSTTRVTQKKKHPYRQSFSQPDEALVREDVALAIQTTISRMLSASTEKEIRRHEDKELPASQSFENVTIALLRTELQCWLNDNLENMVKTIVEKEIKRIMPR